MIVFGRVQDVGLSGVAGYTRESQTLADSKFKELYEQTAQVKLSSAIIWEAVEGLVSAYLEEVDTEEFVRHLKATRFYDEIDDEYGKVKIPKELAILLWSSVEAPACSKGRELCSFLNQCLREDRKEPLCEDGKEPLWHAAV